MWQHHNNQPAVYKPHNSHPSKVIFSQRLFHQSTRSNQPNQQLCPINYLLSATVLAPKAHLSRTHVLFISQIIYNITTVSTRPKHLLISPTPQEHKKTSLNHAKSLEQLGNRSSSEEEQASHKTQVMFRIQKTKLLFSSRLLGANCNSPVLVP